MTDQREETRPEDISREPTAVRRPYAAPELVEYGTVAKLTQTGGATFNDGGGMMRMMFCL